MMLTGDERDYGGGAGGGGWGKPDKGEVIQRQHQ